MFVSLESLEYVPEGQGEQLAPSFVLMEPGGQATQLVGKPFALFCGTCPDEQLEQLSAFIPPAAAEYFPVGQGVGALAPSIQYVPAGQVVQVALPATGAYVPAAQGVQALACWLGLVPAAQGVQLEAPSAEKCPAAHLIQVDCSELG